MVNTEAIILANEAVGSNCRRLHLALKSDLPLPQPGQFALLRLSDGLTPLLGRPFSIYDYDEGRRVISFWYRIVGGGTGILGGMKEGQSLGILAPLGRPFNVAPSCRKLVLVAGGAGMAGLNYLARRYQDTKKIYIYWGAAGADELALPEAIKDGCECLKLATEDGSLGFPGLITELLARDWPTLATPETGVFACGPQGMLAALGRFFAGAPVNVQVSLEERMACGLGACLGCAVKLAGAEATYGRVCCDGPVFDLREIAW